uniref:Protein TIC 214 n=1 Tax=Pseudolarix amabilis TaxID=3355 RepID=A0A193PS30_PSEAD|nr:hypothetical protein [Pseudolarix amabilis]BAV19351.1 hypothetical protein [Pseudolarix amabilis]
MIKVLGLLWDPLSSWIEVSGPIILFGLYYGFITTLPFGPSKIYSMRSFFLGETIYGIIAISGSITGQLIVFLSMYYSPIYAALWKPHAITVLVVPYMFFRFFQINKEPPSSESLHPINSINNPKILSLFMGGLILQLFNPILLANPVLTRLVNLFLFRYGDNISFVISSFCGWLGGHILFIILTKLVSFRIERNSPIDYTILRRYIHRTFSLLLLSYCSFYLGRAPLLFIKNIQNDDKKDRSVARDDNSVAVARDDRSLTIDPKKLQGLLELPKEEQLSWFKQPWPIMFFDHNRAYRPIRYIGNSPFTQLGPVRTEVSQYFFGTYSSDGKQRISFTFLPSVLVLGEKLEKYRDISDTSCSSEDPYHRWIHTMKRRRDYLGNEFSDRVKALSNGYPVGNVMERRVKFSNSQGDSFTEMYDPFLNGAFRGTINQFEFPRMLNDSIISNLSDFTEVFMNDRKEGFPNDPFGHEYHISHHWQELEHESFRLPWEPLPTDTVRSLIPITKPSEKGKIEPISKRLDLLAEQIIPNQARKIFEEYLSNIDSSNIDYSFGNLIYPKDLLEMPSDQIQEIYSKDLLEMPSDQIQEIYPKDDDDSSIHFLWLEIALQVAYIDIVPEIASCNERIYTNYLANIYSRIDSRNIAPTGTIKWELILDLFTTEQKVTSKQIFLFESLAQHEWTILRKFRENLSTDDSTQTKDFLTLYREILLNEPLQFREIRKHVPRWSSGSMMVEYDDLSTGLTTTSRIRPRKVRSTLTFDLGQRQIVLKRYFVESDYRRNLIRGSIRAQRRKIMIWKRIQPNVHSFFFLVRMEVPTYPKDYYDTSDSDRVNMKQIQKEIRETIQKNKELEPVPHNPTLVESLCSLWSELNHLRGLLLVAQSILRKRIILPSLIIAKNIGRILLFQVPEFPQDWEQMRREVHVRCAPDGTEFSETEFPDKWKKNGMQIKLLFPFRLKPWHNRSKLQFEKKLRWSYLTVLGLETDIPYGDPNPKLGPFSDFFQPIFKELIFKKLKRGFIFFKKLKRGLRREFIIFKKLKRRLMGSTRTGQVPRVRYIDKSELNDRIQNRLLSETTPMGSANDSPEVNDQLLSETIPMGSANDSPEVNDQLGYGTRTINLKDPDDRTTTMKERIESIAIINSSPITGMSLVDSEINTGSKGSFNMLGSTFKKRLVQIRRIPGRFRNKSVQLIRKIFYSIKLIKLFLKRMDRDLLPSVIHFIGSNFKFWIRSAWIRSTGNIATIYGRIFILNNDISRINRSKITNYYSINEKIQDFEIRPDRNMFSMSQAYVFHKIWQIRTMNRSYSKYLLESRAQASYPLIKKNIKELLDIQRILDNEKPQDLKENDWKQWLRCSDRYNLSPQIWSRINPQEWRNIVSNQYTCYEERFIPYEQQKDSIFAAVMEPSLRLLRKMNKRYRYDLLSYSYLDSTKDLDILNLAKDSDILNLAKDSDILNLAKDSDILNLAKDSDILNLAKDSDIPNLTKDLDILNLTKDSDIHEPPVQPDIPNDQDITDCEGILREKFIRDIVEEDWKGTDFNIVNGPCSTIDIYDAIFSCTYDHTTMIDGQKTDFITNQQGIDETRKENIDGQKTDFITNQQGIDETRKEYIDGQKTNFITNQQGIDETRKENVGIMDSPEIEKRGSGLDLKFWLFPELLGINNIYDTKSEPIPRKSFLKEERDRMEEEEREETTNVLQQGRSYVQNKKGKEHNRNDEYRKVEDEQTGEVEDEQTGEVEYKQTSKVEDKQTGEVEDEETDEVEKKQTYKVFVQYKAVKEIGEESVFKLSDICRVMSGIKDPDQYLWTNLQEGNVNLNLMFLLLQDDSDENENEIWGDNLIQEDVPRKKSNENEIWGDNLIREDVPRKKSNENEIWGDKKIVIPQPYRLSSILDDQFLMYKIVSISLKFQNRAQELIDGNIYDGSVQRGEILGDEKNILSSLNLEDILLPKRRREFRILNRFDPENDHVEFSNGKDIQNDEELMGRDQHLSTDTAQIIKRFLWPSYRLEDLICMNRYWFNTNDGSRSAMLRIRMYPLTFN